MRLNEMTTRTDMKALLSTLWLFVLINIIFRDIHELFRPGFLEEIMTATANGVQVSEATMLVAGILLQLPIGMIVLSRVLKIRVNRWANIIVGIFTVLIVAVNNTAPDLDDLLFAAVEVISLVAIIWLAWKWPSLELKPEELNPTIEGEYA